MTKRRLRRQPARPPCLGGPFGSASASSAAMSGEVFTYVPVGPDDVPLIGALYTHPGMDADERRRRSLDFARYLMSLAPARAGGRLPDVAGGQTILYVCHSAQSAREAMSLSETRPVVMWAWLLGEDMVAEAEQRVPVVHGPQNTPAAKRRLSELVPSKPEPGGGMSGFCGAIEHAWDIPDVLLTRAADGV